MPPTDTLLKRFALYRILGNDLPPRHASGQQLANLRFLLEHEPPLEDCEKRWVVNRVVDPQAEAAMLAALRAAGQPVLHIPFVADEFAACKLHLASLPPELYLHHAGYQRAQVTLQIRVLAHIHQERIRYVTNINGARNAALADGRAAGATWILPFDGSCFFTAGAWRALAEAAARAGEARYLLVPMARVQDNALLLDPAAPIEATDEPQLGLHRDALETFDERRRYGAMDKAALLHRLGVPGRWHDYARWYPAWDAPDLTPSPEAGRYVQAGWVARMTPGRQDAEASESVRHVVRHEGLIEFCGAIDEQLARRRFSAQQLCFYDEAALERARAARLAAEPPPAGGESAFDALARAVLTAHLAGDDGISRQAGALVRTAFADPAPGLDAAGLAVLRGLPQAYDAVRLLERSRLLADADSTAVREWARERLAMLLKHPQARNAARRDDHVGTALELLLVATALFLDDLRLARAHFVMARLRIAAQFAPGGRQPHERGNAGGERLNLQLWAALGRLARSAGVELPPIAAGGRGVAPYWQLAFPGAP